MRAHGIERVMIAGGGTGGHLFPGIAVVEELRRRIEDVEVSFVGTERGIEARVLPGMGESLDLVEVSPLKGTTSGELARSLLRLPRAYARAVSILRARKPDVVIGVGGYASGPMLVAAFTLGIPTALLEQNAHVGMTNRMLGPVVGRAYLTFEDTAPLFGHKARVVGNPVRRAFAQATRVALADPEGFEARARRILVVGGSQGARALNQNVPAALGTLDLGALGVDVLHQTGAAMKDEVEAAYRAAGVRAEVVPFVEDMARAYASAQLVIARAGATTLAEICAVGRPSVLVPYPHAADDHQRKNAEELQRAGAAISIAEDELSPERLASAVGELVGSAEKRRTMAQAARSLGRPDAAAAIVDDLLSWIGGPTLTRTRTTSTRDRDDDGGGMGLRELATVDFRASRGELALSRSSPPPAPSARLVPVVLPVSPRLAIPS